MFTYSTHTQKEKIRDTKCIIDLTEHETNGSMVRLCQGPCLPLSFFSCVWSTAAISGLHYQHQAISWLEVGCRRWRGLEKKTQRIGCSSSQFQGGKQGKGANTAFLKKGAHYEATHRRIANPVALSCVWGRWVGKKAEKKRGRSITWVLAQRAAG